MRRIAIALRNQEWTTILIEFVLVIVGVLIALQLDQWKDALAEKAEERRLLLAVLDDVGQDILDLENAQLALNGVSKFGATAIASLERGDCIDTCWSTLVAFFHAFANREGRRIDVIGNAIEAVTAGAIGAEQPAAVHRVAGSGSVLPHPHQLARPRLHAIGKVLTDIGQGLGQDFFRQAPSPGRHSARAVDHAAHEFRVTLVQALAQRK